MQTFLTEKDVAKQISVSLASLRRWRLVQRGPAIYQSWCAGEISPRGPGAMDGDSDYRRHHSSAEGNPFDAVIDLTARPVFKFACPIVS